MAREKMDNWNFPMTESTIWNSFGENYDRTDDLLPYNDLEDVDELLSYICEHQSFGTKEEMLCRKNQDTVQIGAGGKTKCQVDDSDISAVVKSALNPMNNINNSNLFEMREDIYMSENISTYGPCQMQTSQDQRPFSSIHPSDQPCSSGIFSNQPEIRLQPNQCMGRFCDTSSEPSFGYAKQQLHDVSVSDRVKKEQLQTQHEFDANLLVHENSCMKQEVLNNANLEAINLLQLHNVMNEMDFGTRRCISDSLYRLAKSTVRRPVLSDLSNGNCTSSLTRRYQPYERSNRIDEGMDTDTNLLDQSIAKLLFYKPLDLATTSSAEAMLLKSGMLIGIPL